MKRKVITSTDYEYIDIEWDGTRYTQRRTRHDIGSQCYIPLTSQDLDELILFKLEVEGGNSLKEEVLKKILNLKGVAPII